MGLKAIADCVEALAGAYYVTGGLLGALHVMKNVTKKDKKYHHHRQIAFPQSNKKHIEIPIGQKEQRKKIQDHLSDLEAFNSFIYNPIYSTYVLGRIRKERRKGKRTHTSGNSNHAKLQATQTSCCR
ncbi:hypothetical protein Droror1_Dr00021431 [Drosera rotundifolia]